MKRVILGINDTGKNSILIDQPFLPPLPPYLAADGSESIAKETLFIVWASDPVHSTEDLAIGMTEGLNLQLKPGETLFMRTEIGPGGRTPFHRTPQISDYLVVLSGKLTMYAEDGSSSVLEPGDMFVQLGGWHAWHNEGDVPFVMAGVVVGVETDELIPRGVEFRLEAADHED
jgi:quercetin dioxygenase-like cupin family protein